MKFAYFRNLNSVISIKMKSHIEVLTSLCDKMSFKYISFDSLSLYSDSVVQWSIGNVLETYFCMNDAVSYKYFQMHII